LFVWLLLISAGKLSLYCAAGGIAPHRVLPVVIDVGTDNEELLEDKYYLGVQKKRLQGKAYYEVIDEFMQAVRYRWPNVLVQFEDFSSDKAQVRIVRTASTIVRSFVVLIVLIA
jgi:malate dehydrogenase (oxaloacetate-decarboxylating)(NADP+)